MLSCFKDYRCHQGGNSLTCFGMLYSLALGLSDKAVGWLPGFGEKSRQLLALQGRKQALFDKEVISLNWKASWEDSNLPIQNDYNCVFWKYYYWIRHLFNFLMFIFERERQRQRQRMSRGGAEKEGDTDSKTCSRLWAVSTEPDEGLKLMNGEIMTWAEGRHLTDCRQLGLCYLLPSRSCFSLPVQIFFLRNL